MGLDLFLILDPARQAAMYAMLANAGIIVKDVLLATRFTHWTKELKLFHISFG